MTPDQMDRRARWMKGVATRLKGGEAARSLAGYADAMNGRAAMQRYRAIGARRRAASPAKPDMARLAWAG